MASGPPRCRDCRPQSRTSESLSPSRSGAWSPTCCWPPGALSTSSARGPPAARGATTPHWPTRTSPAPSRAPRPSWDSPPSRRDVSGAPWQRSSPRPARRQRRWTPSGSAPPPLTSPPPTPARAGGSRCRGQHLCTGSQPPWPRWASWQTPRPPGCHPRVDELLTHWLRAHPQQPGGNLMFTDRGRPIPGRRVDHAVQAAARAAVLKPTSDQTS